MRLEWTAFANKADNRSNGDAEAFQEREITAMRRFLEVGHANLQGRVGAIQQYRQTGANQIA
jgi:hypothetical protein